MKHTTDLEWGATARERVGFRSKSENALTGVRASLVCLGQNQKKRL